MSSHAEFLDHLRSCVHGRTLIDIGGLWNEVNEVISVAIGAGARHAVMADIQPPTSPWWKKFHNRMAAKEIKNYSTVIVDAQTENFPSIVGQFDVVYSSGVIYHIPHFLQYLLNLKKICKERLFLVSMVVPEIISNDHGEVNLAGGKILPTFGLTNQQRSILTAHFLQLGLHSEAILPPVEELLDADGGLKTGPWWWLFTTEALSRLLNVVGLEIKDVIEVWAGRSMGFICVPKC